MFSELSGNPKQRELLEKEERHVGWLKGGRNYGVRLAASPEKAIEKLLEG